MEPNLKHVRQRSQAYWYVDGLYELGTGAFLLLLSLTLMIQWAAIEGSTLDKFMAGTRQFLMVGGIIVAGLAVRFLKTRLTYPRTGYLAYTKPKTKTFVKLLASGLVIGALTGLTLVGAFLLLPGQNDRLLYFPAWLISGLGIFFAALLTSWSLRTGLKRFYLLAGITLLSGLLIARSGADITIFEGQAFLLLGPGIFCGILGISLAITGGWTLKSYLKQTTPGEADESREITHG